MNDRYEAMRHWVWANHLSSEGRKEGVPGCIADEIPACIFDLGEMGVMLVIDYSYSIPERL
jgi:hypothetical protein